MTRDKTDCSTRENKNTNDDSAVYNLYINDMHVLIAIMHDKQTNTRSGLPHILLIIIIINCAPVHTLNY